MKFFSRSKEQLPEAAAPVAVKPRVKMTERDYSALKACDAPIKIWLPESVEKHLDEMCAYVDTSASDLVRQILFTHMYGRYDLFGLMERQDPTYKLSPLPRYSIALGSGSGSGLSARNIADMKIFVPGQMKDDLQLLADRAGVKLSAYIRDAVVSHLYGVMIGRI